MFLFGDDGAPIVARLVEETCDAERDDSAEEDGDEKAVHDEKKTPGGQHVRAGVWVVRVRDTRLIVGAPVGGIGAAPARATALGIVGKRGAAAATGS